MTLYNIILYIQYIIYYHINPLGTINMIINAISILWLEIHVVHYHFIINLEQHLCFALVHQLDGGAVCRLINIIECKLFNIQKVCTF